MKHRVHSFERRAHGSFVAHIARNQFDFRIQIRRPRLFLSVDLRRETVQNSHFVSSSQKFVC